MCRSQRNVVTATHITIYGGLLNIFVPILRFNDAVYLYIVCAEYVFYLLSATQNNNILTQFVNTVGERPDRWSVFIYIGTL